MITKRSSVFTRFAQRAARLMGRPAAFIGAVGVLTAWGISGFLFRFSDTWQLVINTATSLITFLMVFIIQGTQNRDSAAIQIKLDELIRAAKGAHNALLDLEELDETELDRIRGEYEELAAEARHELKNDMTNAPGAAKAAPEDERQECNRSSDRHEPR